MLPTRRSEVASIGLDVQGSEQPEVQLQPIVARMYPPLPSRYRRVTGALHRRAMALRLSETEVRIMRLAVAGLTADEIASALDLSRETVAWHLAQSYRKLGLGSTAASDPPPTSAPA